VGPVDPALRRPAPSFLPATAVLEMTYRCSHACIFCSCPWYATDGGFDERPEMSASDWRDVIRTLCRMGCSSLAFTGGEPLLKEGIEDIIAFAAGCVVEHIESEEGRLVSREGPPNLFLLSNGKSMTDEVLRLCRAHGINLSMSLPGLATFREHTRGGMDPEHVLRWFTRARDAGVATTVGVTVTALNIHELYETIAEALLAGADNLLMNRFLPGGRGLAHADELTLDRDQLRHMLDTAEEVLCKANRKGSVGTELPKCLVEEGRYERLTIGTRCSAARDFFVVGPSGHLRVCNHSPVRLHHVRDVEQLKLDPYWQRFVTKDYLPHACDACTLLTSCDGGCREAAHIVGGEVNAPDPVLCD
jgi:radical SAM protein with 4Fe4S-binding SPASM domain